MSTKPKINIHHKKKAFLPESEIEFGNQNECEVKATSEMRVPAPNDKRIVSDQLERKFEIYLLKSKKRRKTNENE